MTESDARRAIKSGAWSTVVLYTGIRNQDLKPVSLDDDELICLRKGGGPAASFPLHIVDHIEPVGQRLA